MTSIVHFSSGDEVHGSRVINHNILACCRWCVCLFVRSSILAFDSWFSYQPVRWFIRSFSYLFIQAVIQSFILAFTHSLTHACTYSFIVHLLIDLFFSWNSCTHLLIHSFNASFVRDLISLIMYQPGFSKFGCFGCGDEIVAKSWRTNWLSPRPFHLFPQEKLTRCFLSIIWLSDVFIQRVQHKFMTHLSWITLQCHPHLKTTPPP